MPKTAETIDSPADASQDQQAQAPSAPTGMALHKGHLPGRAPAALPVASDPMSVLMLMERMAKNKEVDTTKLAQIREFGAAILSDQRRAAFDEAFAQMQGEMPTISAKGTIEIREKDARGGRSGPVIQSTKYAKWEDINEAIKPVLQKYGFALRFVTGLAEDGRVKVTGILSGHGHREESVFILPHDSTGSKNAVQAIGSSTSYGKRYAACALLNITTRGEDDDASSFVEHDPRPKVSVDQIGELMVLCDSRGCPHGKFLKHIGVETFKDIPAADYAAHVSLINSFRKA